MLTKAKPTFSKNINKIQIPNEEARVSIFDKLQQLGYKFDIDVMLDKKFTIDKVRKIVEIDEIEEVLADVEPIIINSQRSLANLLTWLNS